MNDYQLILTESLDQLRDQEDVDYEQMRRQESVQVTLSMTPYQCFFELKPCREVIEAHQSDDVVSFHESSCQTDFIVEDVRNQAIQLEPIYYEDAGLQVDGVLDNDRNNSIVPIEYKMSAFERMLRYLSMKKYKNELIQWHQLTPSVTSSTPVQFTITPISKYATKILDATYNETVKLYLLLVENDEEISLELWTLDNLLSANQKRISAILYDDEDDEKAFISTEQNYVLQLIGYGHQMVLEDLSDDTTIFTLKIGWLPVGLGEHLYYGCFSSPSSQSHSPARLHFLTDMAAIHCSCMDPSDFDFVEMNGKLMPKDRLIPLNETNYIVFHPNSLNAELWLYDEPRHNSYELQFSNVERAVDFQWHGAAMFSLTKDGEISKWIFQSQRRKHRLWIHATGQKNCLRFVSVSDQKFVIQSATMLIFTVVAPSPVPDPWQTATD